MAKENPLNDFAKFSAAALGVPKRNYYAYLLIYRGRQWAMALVVCALIGIFAYMIACDSYLDKHWLVIAGPLVMSSLVLLFMPPTEEWVYEAWQSRNKQYELHIID